MISRISYLCMTEGTESGPLSQEGVENVKYTTLFVVQFANSRKKHVV